MADTWIILGATSSMARALARALAETGAGLLLAGRDIDDVAATASDALLHGAERAEVFRFDIRDAESFRPILGRADTIEGTLNAAIFVGSMPAQADIDADPSLLDGTITDSFTGPARFLQELAPRIEARGSGCIVGVGSVAGDRGRLSNYVYGSAKAGFHTYLAGLRNRLTRAGAHVVTVKPGFADTAMTWGLDGLFLVAPPEKVASDILNAVRKKRNVIYTPVFWLGIMTIIRFIPEPVMKKLRI